MTNVPDDFYATHAGFIRQAEGVFTHVSANEVEIDNGSSGKRRTCTLVAKIQCAAGNNGFTVRAGRKFGAKAQKQDNVTVSTDSLVDKLTGEVLIIPQGAIISNCTIRAAGEVGDFKAFVGYQIHGEKDIPQGLKKFFGGRICGPEAPLDSDKLSVHRQIVVGQTLDGADMDRISSLYAEGDDTYKGLKGKAVFGEPFDVIPSISVVEGSLGNSDIEFTFEYECLDD